MKASVAHIGIAVTSIREALSFYRDVLGLAPGPAETADGAEIVTMRVGEVDVELLQPADPSSPVAKLRNAARASITSATASPISMPLSNAAALRATSWSIRRRGAGPAAGASRSCIPKRRTAFCWS